MKTIDLIAGARLNVMRAVVVEEQGLGAALAFVVAGAGSDRIHVAPVVFGLGMDINSPDGEAAAVLFCRFKLFIAGQGSMLLNGHISRGCWQFRSETGWER